MGVGEGGRGVGSSLGLTRERQIDTERQPPTLSLSLPPLTTLTQQPSLSTQWLLLGSPSVSSKSHRCSTLLQCSPS